MIGIKSVTLKNIKNTIIQESIRIKVSNMSWFDTLKMTGAVTTTSTGTAPLFNNKAIRGRKKRGKKKKESQER